MRGFAGGELGDEESARVRELASKHLARLVQEANQLPTMAGRLHGEVTLCCMLELLFVTSASLGASMARADARMEPFRTQAMQAIADAFDRGRRDHLGFSEFRGG